MKQEGNTQSEIARVLGFSQGTISKEFSRNLGLRGYRSKQAQDKAMERQAEKKHRRKVILDELEEKVRELLKKQYSPEQISGSLREKAVMRVSHETIYQYIAEDRKASGTLYEQLRINGKRRYRRRAKAGRIGKIPNRIGIEARPAVVDARARYGDWEVDLIEGSKGSGFLLSVYERKSRLGKLCSLENKGSEATASAIISLLAGLKVRTLTYDNGLEFSGHEQVNEALSAESYFCQPYHSWEKGGVENYNGLVRQYFPKGSNFRDISRTLLQSAEVEINQRPRKVLGDVSPSTLEHQLTA